MLFAMKIVYFLPNSAMLGSLASALNDRGVEAEIRNDIWGRATGEIAPGEPWLELWIVNWDQSEVTPGAGQRNNKTAGAACN